MQITKFQKLIQKERMAVIKTFQACYPTKEQKEKALSEMEDKDIDFLCYCADQIQACIFYTSFKKTKIKPQSN